jgi:lipoprotein-anchoring transpeptidase ErfK/SrfK
MTHQRRSFRSSVAVTACAVVAVLVAPQAASAQATVKRVPVQPPAKNGKGGTCGPDRVTTVAAMNNTKYAAVVNVYTEASTSSQLLNSLAVGLEIKGAVVFTVVESQGDWLKVNVPARPNGKTGWIRKSDVHTFQHRYALKIELGAKRMTVCNAGRVIQSELIAVGQTRYPTPTGQCFTEDLLKPKGGPNGVYGPFAFGLSCFSESPELEDWNGGDGRIGIHGTNQPKLLGQAVSHGCIRLSNTAVTKLAKTIPLGVPVEILS